MQIFLILFAVLAGLTNPFQSAANAQLNKQVMQPVWVATCTYVTGLLVLLVLQAFRREPLPGTSVLGQVPWWAWMVASSPSSERWAVCCWLRSWDRVSLRA